jgi:hypothetical protein
VSDFDLFGDYEPERPATLEEEKPRRPPRPPRKPSRGGGGGGGIYKVLAALFLVGIIALVAYIGIIVRDPESAWNVFPRTPSAPTPTLIQLGSGGSDVIPPPVTPTAARFPTTVPDITLTSNAPITPTGFTPLPGGTLDAAVLPFALQNDAVTYRTHPDGCKGLWLIGQVFDLNSGPLPGLPVQVTGSVFQGAIKFTGSAPKWGDSGYEFELNATPVEDQFVVQLLNTTGQPLSEPIMVKTLASCEQNVAVVNFIQNHPFAK